MTDYTSTRERFCSLESIRYVCFNFLPLNINFLFPLGLKFPNCGNFPNYILWKCASLRKKKKGEGGENAPRPDWLPHGCEMLADGEYDAIVMGTGLKEAIMSGLLSTLGMKVRVRSEMTASENVCRVCARL